jgi:hypothetical protein
MGSFWDEWDTLVYDLIDPENITVDTILKTYEVPRYRNVSKIYYYSIYTRNDIVYQVVLYLSTNGRFHYVDIQYCPCDELCDVSQMRILVRSSLSTLLDITPLQVSLTVQKNMEHSRLNNTMHASYKGECSTTSMITARVKSRGKSSLGPPSPSKDDEGS